MQTVKNRISDFFLAEQSLTANALSGEDRIYVSDITNFGPEAISRHSADVILYDSTSTGKRIAGGFQGTEKLTIKGFDWENNGLIFNEKLQNNWLVSNTAKVKRAFDGLSMGQVLLGDFRVALKYPAIGITPDSKTIDWFALTLTKDVVTINFSIYVKEGDQEIAIANLTKLADALEWVLMSNLHLLQYGATRPSNVTSKAGIKSINYGIIKHGNEFIRAANLQWFGDMYVIRDFVTAQSAQVEKVWE